MDLPGSSVPYPAPADGLPPPKPLPQPRPGPPDAPGRRRTKRDRLADWIMVVIIVFILLPIGLVELIIFIRPTPVDYDGGIVTTIGLRVADRSAGNWTIEILSGRKDPRDLRLQVINPSTGALALSKVVASLAPSYNDSDARYNDNNGNNRLDAGDTIQLKSSGGHIHAGYKVQLLVGAAIVGTIKELPA